MVEWNKLTCQILFKIRLRLLVLEKMTFTFRMPLLVSVKSRNAPLNHLMILK